MLADLLRAAALVCTVAGLVAAALVGAATRDVRAALPVLMEFLLAAGLLRLSTAVGWRALAAAAALVVVRRLLVAGLADRAVSSRRA